MVELNTQIPNFSKSPAPQAKGTAETSAVKDIQSFEKRLEHSKEAVKESPRSEELVEVSARAQEAPKKKEKVMVQFLHKMKEELGVEPEDVVLAFSRMDQEALMKPPEEAVDDFVEALEINTDLKPKAKDLFENMLKDSANEKMVETIKSSEKDLALNVMTKQELQNKNINAGIDKLNNNFFVDNKSKQQVQLAQKALSQQSGAEQYAKQNNITQNMKMAQQTGQGQSANGNQGMALGSDWNLAQNSSETIDIAKPVMPTPQATQTTQAVTEQATNQAQNVPVQKLDNQWLKDLETSLKQEFDAESGKQAKQQITPTAINAQQASSEQMNFTEGEGDGNFESMLNSQNSGQANKSASISQTANNQFNLSPEMTSESDAATNTREVVNQARYMIKNGGGEMKVQLTPEGLGEMNLKVNMENGKVNVEMVTQSNEAKKILEKGLSDLKVNLAEAKLNVDDIKVEIAKEIQQEMDLSKQGEERAQQERFLNEFMNQNKSFRNGMFDLPGARPLDSQTDDDAVNAAQTAQSNGKDSGRRLNLVA